MDDRRFDDFTRALAVRRGRRGVVLGLVGAAAGLVTNSAAVAACPVAQVFRSGMGCVCKTTGRPPADRGGTCPCPRGQERCRVPSGWVCIDPASYDRDPLHCGRCGNVCPAATPYCVAGACVTCRRDSDCDDGIACTQDRCVAGVCRHTTVDAVCDGGNPCTINRCDAVAGCVSTPVRIGVPCSDGLLCNGLEVCDGEGRCLAGTPMECGPCLTCSEATQNCGPDADQDGLPCGNRGQVCAAGTCVCPPGTRECDGTCRECCSSADCPAERPSCLAGVCGCRGTGLPCASSDECCPSHRCSSGFCCTRSGQRCVSGEQCCSRGCDFDSDLGFRVCG